MRSSTPEQAAPGGAIVVEAPTASKALEEVSSRLGPRATILEASKVTRGGIGGFFAREMVQLRAQPPAGEPSPADPDRPEDVARLHRGAVTTTAGGGTALERLLAGLSSEVNEREETFGETLRRHLRPEALSPAPPAADRPEALPPAADRPGGGAGPAGGAPAPLGDGTMGFENALAAVRLSSSGQANADGRGSAGPGAGQPAGDAQPAGGRTAVAGGGTAWEVERLLRLGVPAALLGGWQPPASDLDGLVAFAQRVAPLCRPLRAGAAVLAGPRAHRLAEGLGAAAVGAGEPLPAAGPVCARVRDSARGRAWLAAGLKDRWLHLVVGGAGWQRLLLDYPQAVSWCGESALPEALRVAAELALPLGYGRGGRRGSRVVPATPVDVAVAVRDLLVDP